MDSWAGDGNATPVALQSIGGHNRDGLTLAASPGAPDGCWRTLDFGPAGPERAQNLPWPRANGVAARLGASPSWADREVARAKYVALHHQSS